MDNMEKPIPRHLATSYDLGRWEVIEREIKRKQDGKPKKKSSMTDTEWCGQGEGSVGSAHRKYMMTSRRQKGKEDALWCQRGLGSVLNSATDKQVTYTLEDSVFSSVKYG